MKLKSPTKILLIEDNEIDQMLIERAFARAPTDVDLVKATDGLDALAELQGNAEKRPLDPPYLVILDLNMAKNGRNRIPGSLAQG